MAADAKIAILTAGSAGCVVSTSTETVEIKPEQVIDRLGLGAGAMLSALLIDALLSGVAPKIALDTATQGVVDFLRRQSTAEV